MKKNSIEALILDMDGVLWRGSEPVGDLPSIFRSIQERGWRTSFITNNATRTVDFYTEKLDQFGVLVEETQILTSAQATGDFLSNLFPGGGNIFIVGEKGLVETLAGRGFVQSEERPLAVIVSLDRDLTYEKIRRATNYVRAGALFVGTNRDPTLPTPDGIIPGAGSIIAAIDVASGVKPTIIGKPNPEIFRLALARLGSSSEHTLVIGDRLDTDIAGGIASGCQTALVLSGDIRRRDLELSDLKPNYVAENLTELIGMLSELH